MSDEVPRRLKRFYRKRDELNQKRYKAQQEYYSQNTSEENEEQGFMNYEQISSQDSEKKTLERIPSMEYEDLEIDEKNAKDIEEYQKKSEDKELALQEIKKFKKENKRMPNKKETEKIAEHLYTQIKNNPIEYPDTITPEETSGRSRRGRRNRNTNEQIPKVEENIPKKETIEDTIDTNISKEMILGEEHEENIKDLFADTEKKKNNSDEFDLGLETDFSNKELIGIDDEKELQEITGEDSQICSNCKKPKEKTIYCPKCGFAYCELCSKSTNQNEYVCPKCGNKTKA